LFLTAKGGLRCPTARKTRTAKNYFLSSQQYKYEGDILMTNSVKPVPEGFHTATPSLVVSDAAKAIEFYKKAFGAEERMMMPGPGGKIIHAEIKIGDSIIFLSDEIPGMGGKSPQSVGGYTGGMYLYVPDVDEVFAQAVAAGGKPNGGVNDMFWGDRLGHFVDPFGHAWTVATHVADLTEQEMEKGAQAFYASMGERKSA
jgi:PhnB protein